MAGFNDGSVTGKGVTGMQTADASDCASRSGEVFASDFPFGGIIDATNIARNLEAALSRQCAAKCSDACSSSMGEVKQENIIEDVSDKMKVFAGIKLSARCTCYSRSDIKIPPKLVEPAPQDGVPAFLQDPKPPAKLTSEAPDKFREEEPVPPEPTPPVVAPPPEKSWWERFKEWIFGAKTAQSNLDVVLKDFPPALRKAVQKSGGLVNWVRDNDVGTVLLLGPKGARSLVLPGGGIKVLSVVSGFKEGSYDIALVSSTKKKITIKAKVSAEEKSFGLSERPGNDDASLDFFVITDHKGEKVAEGSVNNVFTLTSPKRKAERGGFYCCKDGLGTEGTGYYEKRGSSEECAGLMKSKCSDSSGKEKESQFIGSSDEREAARGCVYGYKCVGDKIVKLCGDDYTSAAGASNTPQGAQPCPRLKIVTVPACATLCKEQGLSDKPTEAQNSHVLSVLSQGDSPGGKFYCRDIEVTYPVQTLSADSGSCDCVVPSQQPTVSPGGIAVCKNGLKCGESKVEGNVKKSCAFKGWEVSPEGDIVASVASSSS